MRRGEVLRLTWGDVEFDRDAVVARSRKQSRQEAETARRIDLHPVLKTILLDWRAKRPRGQFVACDEGVLGPLARHQAVERFGQPLRGTPWAIPGCGDRRALPSPCPPVTTPILATVRFVQVRVTRAQGGEVAARMTKKRGPLMSNENEPRNRVK